MNSEHDRYRQEFVIAYGALLSDRTGTAMRTVTGGC